MHPSRPLMHVTHVGCIPSPLRLSGARVQLPLSGMWGPTDPGQLGHVLYRLRQAHKCSQQCCKPAYARPNDIETGGGEVAVQDDEAAKQIHSQFMQMALQLVDGRLDSSQYEDSCRQLLGMH